VIAQQRIKIEEFFTRRFPRRTLQRVLLVNPPDADPSLFRFDTAKRGRYTNYPPYGLALLASLLREEQVEPRICNLNHHVLKTCHAVNSAAEFDLDRCWRQELKYQLDDFQPQLVLLTCMFSMTELSFHAVARQVIAAGIPLLVGGVHVSGNVEQVFADTPQIDLAILREGENALHRLVQSIRGELDVAQLGQLVVNTGSERIDCEQDLRPSVAEFDRQPAWDLLDIEEYARYGVIGAFYCFKPPKTRFATAITARGCRGRCAFCSVNNFNGKGVRQRDVKSIADELEMLHREQGIGHIMWLDDDLFFDHRRAVALFKEIADRRLDLTWDATNGVVAGSCTDEVIAAAAQSGCIAINIGMESGHPDILRSVNKPATIKDFLQAADVLRRYEQIHASVFLMIGFPGETMEMIMETVRVARQMDLDWYRISQLQPLPNTPLFESMVAQGLIKQVDGKELRFNGGAFGRQAEIEQGRSLATASFNEAFANITLDQVPSAEQLTDIWFYMNYHLNFQRIFHESRPEKVRQLNLHLNTLAELISPENGFSLYFLGFLQYQQYGQVEPQLIARLRQRMATSAYWSDRLTSFGLAVEDLETGCFSGKDQVDVLSGC